jgi:hypothetical protein
LRRIQCGIEGAGGPFGLAARNRHRPTLPIRQTISRERLGRALSQQGNPQRDTLLGGPKAFGVRLSVKPAGARSISPPAEPPPPRRGRA